MHSVTATASGIEVTFDADDHAPASHALFGDFWLRDHGEDAQSTDPETGQRRTDTFGLDPAVSSDEIFVEESGFEVIWSDGASTLHSWEQLRALAQPRAALPLPDRGAPFEIGTDRQLWRSRSCVNANQVAATGASDDDLSVGYGDFIECDETLAAWLDSLHRIGFGFVRAVPAGSEAVAAVAARIGYVRATVFGDIWELSTEVVDHADSAYGTADLEPHTDATYSQDAPGLQLFCCQQSASSGGESVIVDGFAAAADLDVSDAATLCQVAVASRYREPGIWLEAERPVLRCNSLSELVQVSFNNYDRAPFRLDLEDQGRFYRALRAFHELIVDQSRWYVADLAPGDLLVIDNWRVLHGRRAFVGRRRFFGAYLNHEDFASRRRILASA